jgi:branched-chain amino acid transport system ATP-binding protein
MGPKMNALTVEKVWKRFGSLIVLDEAGLEVASGERHAIIGPNGAGKTTFLNVVSGLLQPDSGRVFLGAREITGLSPDRISLLGLSRTFQITNLLMTLTAYENVRLAVQSRFRMLHRALTPVESISDIRERAVEKLTLVNLDHKMHEQVGKLSYGEQRQLEIGVALATDPEVLLLDEPTAGMSHAETERVSQLILSLPRTVTIVIVDHDMDVVFSLAHSVTVLQSGRVIAQGPKDVVRCLPEVMDAYLGHDRSLECLLS